MSVYPDYLVERWLMRTAMKLSMSDGESMLPFGVALARAVTQGE